MAVTTTPAASTAGSGTEHCEHLRVLSRRCVGRHDLGGGGAVAVEQRALDHRTDAARETSPGDKLDRETVLRLARMTEDDRQDGSRRSGGGDRSAVRVSKARACVTMAEDRARVTIWLSV